MTPNEEKLVLELHKKWGNRWSRIARKLPGRTDNEIKNYWRTHMRKEAQEKRKKGLSSSSNSSSSSSHCKSPTVVSIPATETKECSFYDTGGLNLLVGSGKKKTVLEIEDGSKVHSMDEIFKNLDFDEGNCNLPYQTMAFPIWDYCPNDSLWAMDEEESKMLMQPMGDLFHSFPFATI